MSASFHAAEHISERKIPGKGDDANQAKRQPRGATILDVPAQPSLLNPPDPEDLFGSDECWEANRQLLEAKRLAEERRDASGQVLEVGRRVVRFKDYMLGLVNPNLGPFVNGTVVSIYPPRCHVRWDDDEIGTRPMICRLVMLPEEKG